MKISYKTDNFLKLLYMLAYLKFPNIPIGKDIESLELSLACIRLANYYSGGLVYVKLYPEFGTPFELLKVLNKFRLVLNEYIHLPIEANTDSVDAVSLNKIFDIELFNSVRTYLSCFKYVYNVEDQGIFLDVIKNLYPKLMVRFGLKEKLMEFIFNEYRREYKNRQKIFVNLDEISKKIISRVEPLKNKPVENSILGAMTLMHFCVQKYNYKITLKGSIHSIQKEI